MNSCLMLLINWLALVVVSWQELGTDVLSGIWGFGSKKGNDELKNKQKKTLLLTLSSCSSYVLRMTSPFKEQKKNGSAILPSNLEHFDLRTREAFH